MNFSTLAGGIIAITFILILSALPLLLKDVLISHQISPKSATQLVIVLSLSGVMAATYFALLLWKYDLFLRRIQQQLDTP
jgi:tellurite resistance protein TehA-like permease